MTTLDVLFSLGGTWRSTYRLFLSPSDPAYECPSEASIKPLARGRFAQIDYTWAFKGDPQQGSLIVGLDKKGGSVDAVWIDSWHMGDKIMVCHGTLRADGVADFRGVYSAGTGPDWGWRTLIEPRARDSFRLVMFNITPEGQKDLAVNATYRRVPGGPGA
jgi:hypothetical protein